MSIFFHIDVNSAFLSWSALEQLSMGNPIDLRNVPSIVGGDTQTRHGIVTAKSIPAKAFGIETAEPVVSAFKKCPQLIMVSPNFELYHHYSHALMEYLCTYCPYIEQASIDECYMDFTPIRNSYSSPEEAAHCIKDAVLEKFGFTVNIGISDKKVLAKMASDFQKPNLVHTLYSYEIRQKMWQLPVSRLFLCGKAATETLHKLGIRTIGELAQSDRSILEAHMKSMGTTLWQYANGIDDSSLILEQAKAKGVGNSTTLSQDVVTAQEAYKVLLQLCESVGSRLRKQNTLAGMVTTEIKYATFRSVSHQMPLFSPTASDEIIYQTACRLFDELWNGTPIRLLGVRCGKLSEEDEPMQLSLFDYAPKSCAQPAAAISSPSRERLERLDTALDCLREKYGKNIVKRGSLTDSPKI